MKREKNIATKTQRHEENTKKTFVKPCLPTRWQFFGPSEWLGRVGRQGCVFVPSWQKTDLRKRSNNSGRLIFAVLLFISCSGNENKKTEGDHHSHNGHEMHSTSNNEEHRLPPLQTTRPIVSSYHSLVQASGLIRPDPGRDYKVSSRVNGRITKLHITYENSHVKKGQPVMELYSAELNTIQEELLYLHKSKSDSALFSNTKQKLILLGMSELQVNELISSGKAAYTIIIFSPADGYVFFDEEGTDNLITAPGTVIKNANDEEMDGEMIMQKDENSKKMEGRIREGSYVTAGQVLFRVNDLREVFVLLFTGANQDPVKEGDTVSTIFINSKPVHESVTIRKIEPVYRKNKVFASARFTLVNKSAQYKINAPVTALIRSKERNRTMVPAESVVSLGRKKIAWRKIPPDNKFEQLYILTGIEQNDSVEIIYGLTPADEIALHAGFMTDRETIIKKQP